MWRGKFIKEYDGIDAITYNEFIFKYYTGNTDYDVQSLYGIKPNLNLRQACHLINTAEIIMRKIKKGEITPLSAIRYYAERPINARLAKNFIDKCKKGEI